MDININECRFIASITNIDILQHLSGKLVLRSGDNTEVMLEDSLSSNLVNNLLRLLHGLQKDHKQTFDKLIKLWKANADN